MKRLLLLAPVLLLPATAGAAPLRSAKVTRVVRDVRIYQGSSEGRAAATGDQLGASSALHTGRRSRAELTFPDSTLTRIGANSVFSFRSGSRDVELEQGSMLLQVPKGSGGATIRTATVTAAITGSTAMFEYSPGKWVKFINLEGTMKLGIKGRKDKVEVPEGQMLIMHPSGREVPAPVIINLARLVGTSALASKRVFGPLPAISSQRIEQAVARQKQDRRQGKLTPTGVIIQGPGSPTGDGGSSSNPTTDTPVRDTGSSDHGDHQEPPFFEPPFFDPPGGVTP